MHLLINTTLFLMLADKIKEIQFLSCGFEYLFENRRLVKILQNFI